MSARDNVTALAGGDAAPAAQLVDLAARLRALPQGYDTRLGKRFSGSAELSGGEWRRLLLIALKSSRASLPQYSRGWWRREFWTSSKRALHRVEPGEIGAAPVATGRNQGTDQVAEPTSDDEDVVGISRQPERLAQRSVKTRPAS